jgi:hypothetical protein
MSALSARSTHRALIVVGSLLWVVLAFFSFVVPLTPARLMRPAADLIPGLGLWAGVRGLSVPLSDDPLAVAIMVAVFGGLAFGLYGLAVLLSWRAKATRATMTIALGGSLALLATSVVALPNFNGDIYNYMVQGRLSSVHGSNPHYVAADEFPEDPLYPYASRQYTRIPNDYLPAWTLLNAGLASIAGDHPVRALLTYRSAFLLLNLANIALIVGILRKVVPSHLVAGVIVFGWHPIVALEGQSRVDTAMAFYLLLGIFCLAHGRRLLAVAGITLSVFTKWITLPLLGVYFLRSVFTRRWATLTAGVGVATLTAIAVYAPFVQDMDIFRFHLEMLLRGGSSAPEAVQGVLQVGFVGLVLGIAWMKREGLPDLLWGWAVVMLAFLAFLSKISFSWYLIVPMAVVSLIPDWRVVVPAVVLGLGGLGFHLRDSVFNSRFQLPELFEIDRFWVFLFSALAAVGGMALVAVVRNRGRPLPGRANQRLGGTSGGGDAD